MSVGLVQPLAIDLAAGTFGLLALGFALGLVAAMQGAVGTGLHSLVLPGFRLARLVQIDDLGHGLILPNFAKSVKMLSMTTMNISLPESLKTFVDEQVDERGYGTSSEYVRALIRKDQDRVKLRGLLLEGAGSVPMTAVDQGYFDGLRQHVRASIKPGTKPGTKSGTRPGAKG